MRATRILLETSHIFIVEFHHSRFNIEIILNAVTNMLLPQIKLLINMLLMKKHSNFGSLLQI